MQLDQEKLKAMAAELAKDIKSEKDLGALTQQLIKMTVETALNAELDEHLDTRNMLLKAVALAIAVTAIQPSA
jgi:transposase-like protein